MGDVNLIHSNADEMITMAGGAFRHRFGGRFNAAMWFWETADLPERSRPALDIVDELWVASEYLVDVFGQYAQVPVYNIGLASDLPAYREIDRESLGFQDDEFVFLFVYDALSSYGRKNPGKALDAFVAAFAPRFEGVRFVLKVSNLNKFPASQAEILALEEKYPAITVIDEYLPRDGVLDLMAASDIYISLHAAEGYGLTILEAMALGTPTICTGYSGNMDFTSSENSWLVDYEIIATTEPTGPYPKDSVWASPNVDSATALIRHVAENRDEVRIKAERARVDAAAASSLEAYARRLETQLRRVGV
jgi:glycosyltransferase involved in cell wall biosynthesis